MRKFGFKFFSTNIYNAPSLINECMEFIEKTSDTFVELMVVPDITSDDLHRLKKQFGKTEVRIHGPYMGVDTGNKELEKQNRKILAASQTAADIFDSETIIVHAGYGHKKENLEETARQFKLFNDNRIIIENLPYYDNNGDYLHGNTAEEIAFVMNESGCGFCFDFSHAICAALSLNINIETQLKNFFDLNPAVYHICDGDLSVAYDSHLHFNDGNYPLAHFLNDFTADNAYITIETGKGLEQHADLRIRDYQYLETVQKK